MRLGLDIGTNSIGWWLFATTDGAVTSVTDGGVRIFSDGRVDVNRNTPRSTVRNFR